MAFSLPVMVTGASNAVPIRLNGVRKLQGSQQTYRLRVGTYRVIYELYEARLLVEIVRVRHRKDAYRGHNRIERASGEAAADGALAGAVHPKRS
jgi:hypothetical protein